jgi:hypothetical protein
MAGHHWAPPGHTVLVLEAADVLGPAGLGAVLRGVAAVVPPRAAGERQRERVGTGMRCRDHARARRCSSCGGAGYEVGESDAEEGRASEGSW